MKGDNLKIVVGCWFILSVLALQQMSAQETFPCDAKLYFFRHASNDTTYLSYIDDYIAAPSPNVVDVCPFDDNTYNALAANGNDGFLYAMQKDGTDGILMRIDQNCNRTIIDTLPFSSYGTFDFSGNYWFVDATDRLYKYIVATKTLVSKSVLSGIPTDAFDMAFNISDCNLYMAGHNTTKVYDTTGSTALTKFNGFGSPGQYYGAMTIGADGNLYGIKNQDNVLKRLNLTTYTSEDVITFDANPGAEGSDMATFLCIETDAFFSLDVDSFCVGDSITFIDSSEGYIQEWEWYFGDGNTSNERNPQYVYFAPGTYTVKLLVKPPSNTCINIPQDSIKKIIVVSSQVKGATIDTSMCLGESLLLSLNLGSQYRWIPDIGLDDPTQRTNNITVLSDQNYEVIVSNSSSCFDTSYISIQVDTLLVENDAATICEGEQLDLSVIAENEIVWTTTAIGLACDTCKQNSFVPEESDIYTASMSGSSGNLCEQSVSIDVIPCSISYVPNGVSFEGGRTLRLRNESVASDYVFTVYDRFGNEVFLTTDVLEEWNGKAPEGDMVERGVYTYVLRALSFNGEQIAQSGNITVL